MKIESALDIINKGWEENMPSLDKGFLLLDTFVKYPDSKLPQDLDEIYKNFLDYVLFVEGLQFPYFYYLNRILSDSETIGKLLKYIRQYQTDKRLNTKEAYKLLIHINKDFNGNEEYDMVRGIFDAFNLPDKVYSPATIALCNNDMESFVKAYENEDCTELMKALWILKFLLYGTVSLAIGDKHEKLYNDIWFNDHAYDVFFYYGYDVKGKTKDDVIKDMMKLFISKKYRYDFSQYNPALISNVTPISNSTKQYKLNDLSWLNRQNEMNYNETFKGFIKDMNVFSDDSLETDCQNNGSSFLLSSLNYHKDALKNDFDKSLFDTLSSKWEEIHDYDSSPQLYAYYIELYLARISFSYNVVKNVIPNSNILTEIIARFPDLKKWIIGPNSFFDVYFTHLFPVNENKVDVIVQEQKPNSKAKSVNNSKLNRFPDRCDGITKWCQGEDNETYTSALHYLYLFLTGQIAFKKSDLKSDEVSSIKLDIERKTEFINAERCSEEDFIYILHGKLDEKKVSENPIIEWKKNQKIGTKIMMGAFFYVCCGAEIGKDELGNLRPNPGGCSNCYSFNGEEVKLSELKNKGIDKYYKFWSAVIRLCCARAKKYPQIL